MGQEGRSSGSLQRVQNSKKLAATDLGTMAYRFRLYDSKVHKSLKAFLDKASYGARRPIPTPIVWFPSMTIPVSSSYASTSFSDRPISVRRSSASRAASSPTSRPRRRSYLLAALMSCAIFRRTTRSCWLAGHRNHANVEQTNSPHDSGHRQPFR